jgi:hypothetical protein
MKVLSNRDWMAAAMILFAASAVALAAPTLHTVGSTDPTLNLATRGSGDFINGAFFGQFDPRPTGTGYIDPFVRIQLNGGTGEEAGYNTEGQIEFQTKDDGGHNWTHRLPLSDISVVERDDVYYREFILDIDQIGSKDGRYLSLDALRVYQVSDYTLTGYPSDFVPPDADLIYSLDNGGDNWIKLNYTLNSGNGGGDMLALIPYDAFTGTGEYIIVYSQFGSQPGCLANDGFEEWAVRTETSIIPVPGAVFLGSLGLCLVGWLRSRRMLCQ